MKSQRELPHSDEEKRKAAEATQAVHSTIAKIALAEKQVDEKRTELFGGKAGEDRARTIWRGIVAYVNASAPDELDFVKFGELLRTGVERGHSGYPEPASYQDLDLAESRGMSPEASLRFCFSFYQQKFQRFLTWLCAPDKHKEFSREAIEFLWGNALAMQFKPEVNDDADFDEDSDKSCPIYYWKRTRYKTVMSPICKFIRDGIEQYHDGAIELEEAVPIGQCHRPECGRFFLPQRTGRKKFCSTKCCGEAQPRRSGNQNRDYMRLYRLERTPLAALRGKMKSPKTKKWLSQIEKDWPELADRVKSLQQRVEKK